MIATILNVHSDEELILDTINSISTYMTNKILIVVDGASWESLKNLPGNKVKGFHHGSSKSPFRNVALGIKTAYERYKKVDWFCYMEQDVLVTSNKFKEYLTPDIWILGNNGHPDNLPVPAIDAIIGKESAKYSYYLLGCCQFMNKNFIQKLVEEYDFFNRFLGGSYGFTGYDMSEYLYPTLVRCFGEKVGILASWSEKHRVFRGSHYFPMRYRPEIEEDSPEASLVHPVKSMKSRSKFQRRFEF